MILKKYLEETNMTQQEFANEVDYCMQYVGAVANFTMCPGKKFKKVVFKYTKGAVTTEEWLCEESHKKLLDERKKQKKAMDKLKKELMSVKLSQKMEDKLA